MKTKEIFLSRLIYAVCITFLIVSCRSKTESQRIEWSHAGIGGGGAMFNPAVSPHDKKFAFATCDMGGSFVTLNGGDSWRMFTLGSMVLFFVFDPVNPNVVYAQSFGLFKSEDKGLTWTLLYPKPSEVLGKVSKGDHASEILITSDTTRRSVLALAIDPTQSKHLYAAIRIDQSVALYFSADGGEAWNKEMDFEQDIMDIFIDPSSPVDQRTLYVAWSNGVYQRINGLWQSFGTPNQDVRFNFFSGGYDAGTKRFILYAVSGTGYFNRGGDTQSGIYFSDNGGKSWENRQDGLLNYCMPGMKKAEFRALATSANNPATLYISYNDMAIHPDTTCIGVAKSEDFGKTWTLPWQDYIIRDKPQVPMSNYSGCWLNDRFGPSWGENPFSLAISPVDATVCYGTDFGRTIKTENGGKTWEPVYSKQLPDGSWTTRGMEVNCNYNIFFDPFDADHAFIALTDIGLIESKNGGKGWLSATFNNGVPRRWYNATYWMVFDPEVKGRVWAAMSGSHDLPRPKMWRSASGVSRYEGGVLVSNDGGTNWKPISDSMGEGAVTHILLDPKSDKNARTLYASVFGKGVYKSTDGGSSWVQKNNGLEGAEPLAWRIEQRESDRALFLIVNRRSEDGSIGNDRDGALYKSTDGAETWTKMMLPEGCNGPTSIVLTKKYPKRLVLSAWGRATRGRFTSDEGGGIFVSDDEGTTWSQVMGQSGDGILPSKTKVIYPDQHIHDVTFDPHNGRYYACGFNASAYYSEDGAKTWTRIRGYNFKWGRRVEPDPRDPEMIFVFTFGGGMWYGPAKGDPEATEDILTYIERR